MEEGMQSAPWGELPRREVMQTPDEVAAMLRLKALGWGVRRIAGELGCSHMTVRPDRPGCLGFRGDRVLDPHHGAAGGAGRAGKSVDVGHDLARLRGLGRLARRHEPVL